MPQVNFGGCGTTRNNAGFDGCADKAKVRAEFVTVPVGFANETSYRWIDSGMTVTKGPERALGQLMRR
jgi:hypothetical protein